MRRCVSSGVLVCAAPWLGVRLPCSLLPHDCGGGSCCSCGDAAGAAGVCTAFARVCAQLPCLRSPPDLLPPVAPVVLVRGWVTNKVRQIGRRVCCGAPGPCTFPAPLPASCYAACSAPCYCSRSVKPLPLSQGRRLWLRRRAQPACVRWQPGSGAPPKALTRPPVLPRC